MASFSSNCDFFFFKLSNCFIKIVPLKLANACPPEAAAVHAVEEAKHRTKFASVLAFLHTFMTLDRRCFFCSTLLLIEMLMLLLAILKGSTSNREMWGSVCQGRHVTSNGEALVPVPFGTMFIRLCHTSKCNYLLQNMSLYMREMDRETERESIGHEKEEWEERKNEEGRRRWERRWWYHDSDDYRHNENWAFPPAKVKLAISHRILNVWKNDELNLPKSTLPVSDQGYLRALYQLGWTKSLEHTWW